MKITYAWCMLGLLAWCPAAQAQAPAKQAALDAVEALDAQIHRMSRALWDFSETALYEYRSAELLIGILERDGFDITRGVAGMPTAFVARYGEGSPVIGILAEYDALPGVGNAPAPMRQPRADGITSGQGCGHNLFGAASVGAALALRRVMASEGLPGTIVLYGTPAEETVVGKVYMARDGVFDDADAVLEWHPGLTTEVRNQPGRAMNNFTVEFFGQAAHASADPWNGRSALDAVELMNYGVNLMREHVQPTTRIHYVMPNAGEVPNVVPEYAKVWYFVRDVNRTSVDRWYAWILDIASAAAQGTRTTHKVFLNTGVHQYNLNRPLQEALQTNLELVGPVAFTEDEEAFARALQEYLDIEAKGFEAAIKPLASAVQPARGGSTDVAEVSYIVPTAGFSVTTAAAGLPWHSWATSASHGTDAAVKGALVAAKVLASTGVDLLTDPALVAAAKAHFDEQTDGAAYQSPLPEGQAVPLPVEDP